MVDPFLGKFEKLETGRPMAFAWLLAWIAVAAVIAVFYYLRVVARRRRWEEVGWPTELSIDVSALDATGPPPGVPQLEFYNLPVRLAALVLAPVGRDRTLPPPEQLREVLDSIVPGLADVVRRHRPQLYYWPPQLSPRGFAHSFFKHAPLPGKTGRGTPWCSAAGVFKVNDQPVMAGLILRAESNNSFSQLIVELETKWLDVLRIRRQE